MTDEQNEVVAKTVKVNKGMLDVILENGEVAASVSVTTANFVDDRLEVDGVIYSIAHFTPSERERLNRITSGVPVQAMPATPSTSPTEALAKWGFGLQAFGFVWAVVGLIAGVVIAFQSVEEAERYRSSQKAYPMAEAGISLALSSVAVGVLMAAFGVFAMAYAENNRD